jgi:hypothetical protein
LGISDVSLYTGIYGLVKAVASIIFYVFLIDIWGRRHPTILSSIACSLCLWTIGAYVKIGHPADIIKAGHQLSPSTAAGGRAATGMIMIYSVLYGIFTKSCRVLLAANLFLIAGLSDLMEFLGSLRLKFSQELCVTFLERGRHFANGMKFSNHFKTIYSNNDIQAHTVRHYKGTAVYFCLFGLRHLVLLRVLDATRHYLGFLLSSRNERQDSG